ncbi:zinc-dependent peptidase [Sphingobacterium oryzagri]|uniref:Zinc-dependent peptidase n=1 Tax=Sphingobacterium oryzagri TaxID=3025669 RepID=A0ABY7WL79_9SPHI|nr:M90 family metallopeptidase [Sphingobacterium sp. KACC 22765]WDF69163.1 zinc-dependent peptidase [Sphingobacterium sp. KACC 22765]
MINEKFLLVILIVMVGVALIWYVFKYVGNKKYNAANVPDDARTKSILDAKVTFFQQLKPEAQQEFMDRVDYFLTTTKISAEKGAEVTDEDRILVAASATIPLFHFKQWSFENLDEVLIYPGTFNEKYDTEKTDNTILGMVGDGAMNRKMILSLASLRAGFSSSASTNNTAIHEFVHLIDKADGEVDGIPSYLISKELIKPWLQEMHRTIEAIRKDRSDIRDYAATNEAEFLAVVSEYFFQKPHKLQEDHPTLFNLLEEMYNKPHGTAST